MIRRETVGKTFASGAGMGLAVLLLVGIPSGVIPNPYFIRPLDARPTDYVFLAVITALAVALGATYGMPARCSLQDSKALGSGLLLFIGIGCPVCNKVVIALAGASGALTYFEPVQPLFSFAAIILMGVALALRIRGMRRSTAAGRTANPAIQAPQPSRR